MPADDVTPTGPLARIPLPLLALVVPVVAVVAVLITGPTWSASGASGASGGASTVHIRDFTFVPATLTVAPGATVTVVNSDSTTHTMSSTARRFDTSNLAPGRRATITAPRTPGRYRFVCRIHPTMVGTLVVSSS